jgi:hypothetical protein
MIKPMKNLTKFILVVIVFTITTKSFSQTFGVKGGLNLSNLLEKDNEETYSTDYKMKPGFHVGATAEFPINDIFAFETGLLLSTKGFKYSDSGSDGGYDWSESASANAYYLDIPLTGKGYFDLGSAKIYGVFGPYIGIGLSGKYKYEYSYYGESGSESETIEWGNDSENDHLKRLDFGLTFGAGVEIKSVQIGLAYNLGLKNISADTGDGYKINNRVLAISLAYRFGGE